VVNLTIQLELFARSNFTHLGYFNSQCACDCEGYLLVTIRKVRINFIKMNSTHRKIGFIKENVSDISFILSFLQDYSKEAVAHVQMFLMKNEVPVNLFEVSVNWNQSV